MTGFLLDTNVPSELTRPKPIHALSSGSMMLNDDRLFFSAVSLDEIFKGGISLQ
jgi:predicted nucleic acid-binding protein